MKKRLITIKPKGKTVVPDWDYGIRINIPYKIKKASYKNGKAIEFIKGKGNEYTFHIPIRPLMFWVYYE